MDKSLLRSIKEVRYAIDTAKIDFSIRNAVEYVNACYSLEGLLAEDWPEDIKSVYYATNTSMLEMQLRKAAEDNKKEMLFRCEYYWIRDTMCELLDRSNIDYVKDDDNDRGILIKIPDSWYSKVSC